jgi:hypothetical protein
VRCVCCGQEIRREWPDLPEAPTPDRDVWHGAIVSYIRAGLGSKHDIDQFYVGICDPCADDAIRHGRLIEKCER